MEKMSCSIAGGLLLGMALLSSPAPDSTGELLKPFRVLADGAPIDVEVGHAAPLVADLDGDGKADLLVGQFGGGKLRIYRNQGSNSDPRFGEFAWFKAGGVDGKVPSG